MVQLLGFVVYVFGLIAAPLWAFLEFKEPKPFLAGISLGLCIAALQWLFMVTILSSLLGFSLGLTVVLGELGLIAFFIMSSSSPVRMFFGTAIGLPVGIVLSMFFAVLAGFAPLRM